MDMIQPLAWKTPSPGEKSKAAIAPPANEPAMPRMIVIIEPMFCLLGMISRALAPTMSPKIIQLSTPAIDTGVLREGGVSVSLCLSADILWPSIQNPFRIQQSVGFHIREPRDRQNKHVSSKTVARKVPEQTSFFQIAIQTWNQAQLH
jgi:hypothetical protein